MNVEGRVPNRIENEILKKRNRKVPLKMANQPVEFRQENEMVGGEVALVTMPFPHEESIHFSDRGELFIRSYRSARTDKLVQVPERIPGKGIPKVELVRHTPFPHVEKAIRHADHIAEEYDRRTGKESQSVTTFIKLFRTLSTAYQDLSITEDEFKTLAEQSLTEAEKTGYGTARLEWKHKVFDGLLKSFQRDRLNRRNRGASRMRAAHLYPLTTEARLVNEKTYNKYRKISFLLLEERGRARDKFEDVLDIIQDVRSSKDVEYSQKRRELMEFAYAKLGKQNMKFAPYSEVAAKVRFLLLGKEGDVEKLKDYIGKEEALKFKKRKEFWKMDNTHQKARLKEISKILEETLLTGDRNLNESSDDWVWQEH